ncbi:hypothetical protein ZWY2020_054806 [Hordeum vulgare]|nr:hypothetical protein ZWY2020_054806 [Hordeum vulgare]
MVLPGGGARPRRAGRILTHCGWNSVLESVWAGVPMLCFPLLTDQFTNRRLVVREWRVGVPIGDRGKVFADEVAARIQGVISGEEGQLRQALKKVRASSRPPWPRRVVAEELRRLRRRAHRPLRTYIDELNRSDRIPSAACISIIQCIVVSYPRE